MINLLNKINGKILISPCLLGLKTRYDGESKEHTKLVEILKDKDILFYCPEQGGGLATPRLPAEIQYGKTANDIIDGNAKILNKNGEDVTKEFLKGAYETLKLCKKFNIKYAILKSKSPSCGLGEIYDGTFTGKIIQGNGITAELLKQNNIQVFTEKDFE